MRFPFQVLRVSALFPASVGDPDEGRGGNEPLSAVAMVICASVYLLASQVQSWIDRQSRELTLALIRRTSWIVLL